MDVRNCRTCGKLFNYLGGAPICQACVDKLEEKFQVAKKYIYDNSKASIHEVAEAAEVSTKQVEKWIREERLTFSEDSGVCFECEKCGAMIRTGRFCAACKGNMSNDLSGLYQEPKKPEVKKDPRESARMRFLSK